MSSRATSRPELARPCASAARPSWRPCDLVAELARAASASVSAASTLSSTTRTRGRRAAARRRGVVGRRRRRRRRRRRSGRRDDELAAPAAARRSSRRHRAAVQLDQAPAPASGRCPGPPCGAVRACGRPARTGRRCGAAARRAMPMPVVAHARPRPAAVARRAELDAPAVRRVLGGVVSRLARPAPAASGRRRTAAPARRRRRASSCVARCLDAAGGPSRRPRHDRRASSTARCCSSILPRVIRETSSRSSTRRDRWLDLALDHLAGALDARGVVRGAASAARAAVRDRRQRVAQLVGQHRQELVLAAARLLERRSRSTRSVMSLHDPDVPVPRADASPWLVAMLMNVLGPSRLGGQYVGSSARRSCRRRGWLPPFASHLRDIVGGACGVTRSLGTSKPFALVRTPNTCRVLSRSGWTSLVFRFHSKVP